MTRPRLSTSLHLGLRSGLTLRSSCEESLRVSKKARRGVCLPLVMLALVLGGQTPSYSVFHCHSHSVVRLSCCCPTMEHASAPVTGKTLAGKDCCCDIDTIAVNQSSADTPRMHDGTAVSSLVPVALSSVPLLLDSPLTRLSVTNWPSGIGPPLALVSLSLRI